MGLLGIDFTKVVLIHKELIRKWFDIDGFKKDKEKFH